MGWDGSGVGGGVSRLRNEPVLINVQCLIVLGKCVCQSAADLCQYI